MIRWLKLFGTVSCVLGFVVTASVISLFVGDVWKERKILSQVLQRFTKWIQSPLAITLNVKNQPKDLSSHLVVANHMSYLDVFMLASLYPTSYVTSVEMRDTPVLGHLCRVGACVFVERRNKVNIQNEIQEITEGLEKGLAITIFPEATSTNGDEVIRFRKPLFNSAVFAKATIQPVCINYRTIDGKKIDLTNRDKVCWYGDMTFGGHFLNVLKMRDFVVDVEFLEAIPYEPNRDLDTLVTLAHTRVKDAYDGFSSQAPQESKDSAACENTHLG